MLRLCGRQICFVFPVCCGTIHRYEYSEISPNTKTHFRRQPACGSQSVRRGGREFPSCSVRTLRNSHFSFRESGLFGGVFGRFIGAAYANEATKRSIVVLLRKVFPALPKVVEVCCRRLQRLSNRCKSCVYRVLRTISAPDRSACRFRRTARRDRKAA